MTLQPAFTPRYDALVGVGGIGTGLFFALEGDHTLGRNESRPARQLDVRDYCKLHIIAHYVSVLMSQGKPGTDSRRPFGRVSVPAFPPTADLHQPALTPFAVLPIGRVGHDAAGARLIEEMAAVGMDVRLVKQVPGHPTLLSVCFQYPDGSGGNITTSNGAAATITNEDIDHGREFLARHAGRVIALAAPEVPLERRLHLMKLAGQYGALRAASLTSAEEPEAISTGLLRHVDLLAINEDEAAALAGQAWPAIDPADPLGKTAKEFLDALADKLAGAAGHVMQTIVSAGALGAYAFDAGRWVSCPACRVNVVSTAGAGDALFGGILTGLAMGLPLIPESENRELHSRRVCRDVCPRLSGSALELGVLLAGLSVTSPHTIYPDLTWDILQEPARS